MSSNSGEVFTGGATTSQHVDAEDDDHFQNTTFKLKRTRSLGLLDEFIDSEQQEKQIEKKNDERAKDATKSPSDTEMSSPDEQPSAGSGTPDSADVNGLHSSPKAATNPTYLTSPDLLPHDDTDLVAEPSRHVDYLSHQWDVSDISKTWRYVILRRKNVANAARLENASWRTWAQRRSNLKTISPEEVNWSKESDVTWLYGPIVDDDDHDHECSALDDARSLNTATNVIAGDVAIPRKSHRPKPILKKRTVQDMMISHLNLLKLEIASARAEHEQMRREDAANQARRDAAAKSGGSERPPEYFDFDAISAKLNSQYKNYSQQNSANNSSLNLAASNSSAVSSSALELKLEKLGDGLGKASAGTAESRSQPEHSQPIPKAERHIHFNDEVQQCIAIDDYYADDDDYDDYDEDDNDYSYEGDGYLYESYNADNFDRSENYEESEEMDDDDDEDEGGFFLNVRSPSSASMPNNALPGLLSATSGKTSKTQDPGYHSDDISEYNLRALKTIHLLPPTTLNYGSLNEDSDESNPYTSSISHNVNSNSSRGYDYYYDYNTVYQVDPNHAIYGDASRNKNADVVDVPENITMGSNFDYEIIENEGNAGYGSISPDVTDSRLVKGSDDHEKIPISSLDNSAPTKERVNPFSLDEDSESDSDSDSEQGLSISARNSSQSLAQLVFGQPLTAASNQASYPEHVHEEAEPEARHISSINPHYSSSALSKQPHSSNSLSDQFYGGSMTKANDDGELKLLFFNSQPDESPTQTTPTSAKFSGTLSPPVQRKANLVPPHTTSANAFLGSRTASKKSFIFESESESGSELESEAVSEPPAFNDRNPTSYLSLYEVAGRNGIAVPHAEEAEAPTSKKSLAMSNFLNSWNKGSQ